MVRLIYPVSDYELDMLMKGRTATPHYHDVLKEGDTFMAIIGKKHEKKRYDSLRKKGINLLSCRLNDGDLLKLQERRIIEAIYADDVHLVLIREEDFRKFDQYDGQIKKCMHELPIHKDTCAEEFKKWSTPAGSS